MELQDIIALSRRYGSDPEAVLAGGGNTSAKDPHRMYIKCSGVQLATMDEAGFVPIDRHKMDVAMAQSYPAEDAAREAAFLQAVMATLALPGETRRPSVEAPLHNLFPQRLVLHVHPALINGLTCSREGEAACRRLFGDQVLWVPLCRPGYVLASLCREAMARHKARTGRLPQILLLQNHGIFVAGDTPEEIDGLYAWVRDTLAKEVRQVPDLTPAGREVPRLTQLLKERCQMEYAAFSGGRDILALARSPQAAAPVLGAFTPDHIVYYGAAPAYMEGPEDLAALEQIPAGCRLVLVGGSGSYALGHTQKAADTAALLFQDAVKIAVYSQAFGGYQHMTQELTDFITHWEVESYRKSQMK